MGAKFLGVRMGLFLPPPRFAPVRASLKRAQFPLSSLRWRSHDELVSWDQERPKYQRDRYLA